MEVRTEKLNFSQTESDNQSRPENLVDVPSLSELRFSDAGLLARGRDLRLVFVLSLAQSFE